MTKQGIREVLASNLKHYMKKRGLTQSVLGKNAGLGQTTISLYLSPERRKLGKSGKVAAPNLGHIESLAEALKVEIWELLRPMEAEDREAYEKIEAEFAALQEKKPPPAPLPTRAQEPAHS